jgi:hypothetical protein
MNFTTRPKKQKTYGRFFGMIFLERSKLPLSPALQQLAHQKSFKNRKSTKKSCIFQPIPLSDAWRIAQPSPTNLRPQSRRTEWLAFLFGSFYFAAAPRPKANTMSSIPSRLLQHLNQKGSPFMAPPAICLFLVQGRQRRLFREGPLVCPTR